MLIGLLFMTNGLRVSARAPVADPVPPHQPWLVHPPRSRMSEPPRDVRHRRDAGLWAVTGRVSDAAARGEDAARDDVLS